MLKHFTTKILSSIMLLMFIGMSSAYAADLGALQINTIYECTAFNYTTATFTPEASGTYRINYSMNDPFAIYSNSAMNILHTDGADWGYMTDTVEGLAVTYYEIYDFEAGTTYYFGGSEGQGKFFMSDVKFVITASSSEITLEKTVPVQNSVISVGTTEKIDFIFNSSISVESATIKTGNESVVLPFNSDPDCKVRVYSNTVSVILKDVLLEWLNNEIIKADDMFTVTLNGVGASTEDGSVTVSFISAGMPGKMISSTNTPDQMPALKSYYMMSDESGVISFEFNQELLVSETDGAFAMLGTGNKESEDGDYYEEVIPCIIEGNILKIDLRGKLRNLNTMGLSMNYGYAQLDIKNVKTSDGHYVYSEGSGKLGSFNYMYNFEIVDCSLMSEFTPSKGEITAGDDMEIWISGYNNISYTGVNFAYLQDGEEKNVVVGHDKIVVEADALDETASLLKFKVPVFTTDADTDVVVSLANLEVIDGLNHASDISATYSYINPSQEIILAATPADGEVVESLVTIFLEWQGAALVSVDPMMMVGGAKLYRKGDTEVFSDMICGPTGTANTAVLDILNFPTEPGEYEVKVEAGMFEVDGEKWPAFTLNYTIGGGVDVVMEDKGETPLSLIEMTISPCENIETVSGYPGQITLAYLVDGISEVGYYDADIVDGNTINLSLKSSYELEDGNYVVWIPEGYFLFDGKECADIKVYFDDVVFVGINDINVDLNNLTIFNINGVLIKNNANINDLNNLDAGVYVVNGRKVIINK